MSNNHYYTPIQLHDLFEYIFPKIDFRVEDLTTDTGCTFTFKSIAEKETDDPERDFISGIMLKTKQTGFEIPYNSHDWIKIYKHAFQHTELVNFHNIKIMKLWHTFSNYFREACKNDQINYEDCNLQLKHFMAMLIFHQSELQAKCLHQFFQLAFNVQENIHTKINSEKVANMLGGIFYTCLKIEGINRIFKLSELDIAQQNSYKENIQKTSKMLKYIIEDPFFEQDFNKNEYAQFLIIGNTTAISPQNSPRIEVISYEDRLPDESFIKNFKLKNSCNESDLELPINEIRNLSLSEKRPSRRDDFSSEDSNLRVSFSDECLMKRSPRRYLYTESSRSPERRDKIDSPEAKKKNHWASSSLGEKQDKLEKKHKEEGEVKQSLTKFEVERSPDIERRSRKILLFSNNEASVSNRSSDSRRKEVRSTSLSPRSSPEIERRTIYSDNETNLSPGPKILLSKETSLSPDAGRRKLRRSKEVSPSRDVKIRKFRSSLESSLSPDNKRRVLISSEEMIPEIENQALIFSCVSNGENPAPEPNNEVVVEGLSLAQNSGMALK